ncbi:MAG TPA: glycosyltransferase family 39 protein [Gemmatimonadaceae bacterium]
MNASGAATADAVSGRRSSVYWWVGVAMVAILLPVGVTARWFNATYGATLSDVSSGVWLLKASVVGLALAAILLRRIPGNSAPGPALTTDATATWIVLAIVVLGLALRLNQLDSELWLDEILLKTRYAPLEFRQLLSTYDSQNHQPLYSILARLAFLALGATDWSVRVPAVLLGVASLWAVWWFGRAVTTTSEARLAALILAVSYHHVWFSQNARGYTAMLVAALLTTGLFLRLCEGSGRAHRLAWGYAVVMALGTYTHLTVAFIAMGHVLALLLSTPWASSDARRRVAWPMAAIALSALMTVVLYAPMLPQVWRQVTMPTMQGVAVEWTGASWMAREGLRVLAQGIPGGLVTVVVALAVLGIGVGSYWRQSRLTTLAMFTPVVVTFVAIVSARHNLWPRFFFFAAGFFVLAALRGGFVIVRQLVRWHPERVSVAGALAVALLSLVTVPRAWEPKQQFRAAYDFVERERQPGDEVVALDIAAEVYQLRGWASTWHRVADLNALRDAERTARRTWIVYTLPARLRAVTPELFQHVSAPRYQVVRVFPASVGGGEIHVLRHDPATGHD